MEVVTIEKRTFSYVCEQFTEFAKRIECPLILSILQSVFHCRHMGKH